MFKAVLFAVAFPVLRALADPVPDAPSPGEVFNEGSSCHIEWAPDTTGQWTTMNIELMTGDNFNMVHLTSEFNRFIEFHSCRSTLVYKLLPRAIRSFNYNQRSNIIFSFELVFQLHCFPQNHQDCAALFNRFFYIPVLFPVCLKVDN